MKQGDPLTSGKEIIGSLRPKNLGRRRSHLGPELTP